MANEEHLKILKQGVEAWNQWRVKNEDVKPDLTGANLQHEHLKFVNFSWANLKDVLLSGADMAGANLVGVDLEGANLKLADLYVANLTLSNLIDANFAGADLGWANLTEAFLHRTNFDNVSLYRTIFGAINLATVKGLESCNHVGPSIIDHRTLMKSGRLPLVFLRGCGLPDSMIDYLPSLLNEAIQFYSCFISYSSKDQEFAERLHSDLQNKGIRCWFALEDIKVGKKIHHQIDEAIRRHDKLLLILSEHSMKSTWVETEIRKARKRESREERQVLFPVSITSYENVRKWELFDSDEGRDLAAEVREYFIPDFSNWKNQDEYQKAFNRLLLDLKAEGKA